MAADSLDTHDRLRRADAVRLAAEAVLLALVALSPWPFASVEPGLRFGLYAGVGLVVVLWFVHVLIGGRLVFRADAVTLGLFGLTLFTALQTVPLPESVVRVVSPTAVEFHHFFRPDVDELLPGETTAAPRPTSLPLSLDPSRTRDTLVQLVAVFLAYAAARNFVYRKGAFPRLAWVAFANGVLLALVALMQFFSSPKTVVFWRFPTEGQVFGPFVNKNHYPFYLSLCIGSGLALLLAEWQRQDRESAAYQSQGGGWLDALLNSIQRVQTPTAAVLVGGLGLMLASVPFSLSRGGLLSVIGAGGLTLAVAKLARRRDREGDDRPPGGGGAALLLIGVAALALGAWFGWKPVEERLNTLWQSPPGLASGERLPLWRDLWTAAREFPLVGAGAGTTIHLEVMTRVRKDINSITYDHAHNEYLEALIEGGVVRLALALVIVAAALWAAASGYVRHRRRSTAPFLLGAFFGLAEIALHSIGDFGIHIPAVALFAATAAAFVTAAREELATGEEKDRTEEKPALTTTADGRTRIRRRVRVRTNGDPGAYAASRSRSRERREAEVVPTLTGSVASAAAFCAVIAAGLVVVEGWRSWAVKRWSDAAAWMATDYDNPERMKLAADNVEGALHVRPDSAALWNDLAAARMADAFDKAGRAAAAVAGPAAYLLPPEAPPPAMLESHVIRALRAARTARDLCPVMPGPHLRLGTFAKSFAKSEPPAVHFARAKRAAPADAEIRFLSGADALSRGDREAAWADWKEALRRSRSVLPLIVRATAGRLSPEELRTRVLPDDPSLWVFAADLLYPDTGSASPERQAWLRAAVQRWKAGPPPATISDWLDWGKACEELGDRADALTVWRRGVEAFPNSEQLRDRLANRLEEDEQYAEAMPHLEWLRSRYPGRVDLRDRADAAAHALKLQREIDGK